MTTTIRSKTVTARKAHDCRCCGAVAIQPGEKYVRQTLVHDGQVYDWVMCDPCGEIVNDVYYWAAHPDDGVTSEDFTGWAEEMAQHGTEEEKARALAFLVRAGLEVSER